MKIEARKELSSDGSRVQKETLSYGQFYGAIKERHELSRFSVAMVAADAGSVTGRKHDHESAHIVCVLAGHYLTSFANRQHLGSLGELVFVPAGTTHEDHFQTLDARTLNVSISNWQINQAREYVRLPEVQADFKNGEISFIVSRLAAECRGWTDTSFLSTEGLCLELLGALAKQDDFKDRKPPRWLFRAKELLHDQFRDSLSITAIAEAANVHPIHLIRTFRRFFNVTPGEYVRTLRLETAASLLRTDLSIAQVALESGFSDQSQLSRNFKRKFGLTPSEFRRLRSFDT